jgi:hypothetical protein
VATLPRSIVTVVAGSGGDAGGADGPVSLQPTARAANIETAPAATKIDRHVLAVLAALGFIMLLDRSNR